MMNYSVCEACAIGNHGECVGTILPSDANQFQGQSCLCECQMKEEAATADSPNVDIIDELLNSIHGGGCRD